MIYTVTLNPAIDRTIHVTEFHDHNIHSVKQSFRQAAGKGINVSFALHAIGLQSTIVTLLGGENGNFIHTQLKGYGFSLIVQSVEGNTRENIKIVPDEGAVIELNEDGPTVSDGDVNALMNELESHLTAGDLVVFTGSLPPGIPPDTYQTMIQRCHKHDVITVLDASNEAFRFGITAKPDVVKPNLVELEQYCGHPLSSTTDIAEEACRLVKQGVNTVLVTMGGNGSLLVDAQQTLFIAAPNVTVNNTVGAGDTFVAGFIAEYNNRSITERFVYAATLASCSVMAEGTGPGDLSSLANVQRLIELQTL